MSRIPVPLSLFVAQRYLRSPRRDAFVTFLSWTATTGIALGVAALILSSAALSGFQSVLRDEVLSRSPQIEITPQGDLAAERIVELARELDGVATADRWVRSRGWILAAGLSRPVEIVGFEGALPGQFPDASRRDPGLYLSQRLVQKWRLLEGDVVEVISARPTLSPIGPQPRVRRLFLHGTFAAARSEQEERVAMPIDHALQLFGSGAVRVLVGCERFAQAPAVARRLRDSLGAEVRVESWQDLNRALFFLLRLEKSLVFVAVFLIVVVAAMAVISDLMLILAHKQAEVGMLGAMGTTPARVRHIFLWLGGLLVGVGCLAGGVLGILGAWLLDRFRVLALPGEVYFVDHVPFLVRWQDVAIILIATAGLTLACAWFGARRAGDLQPVEALRR